MPRRATTSVPSSSRLKRPLTPVPAIRWARDGLRLLDQTLLPDRMVPLLLRTPEEVWEAIRSLRVRGAPAIGIAAAYGLVLGLQEVREATSSRFFNTLSRLKEYLAGARPTAVNLAWALNRVARVAEGNSEMPPKRLWKRLLEEAHAIKREEIECNLAIGRHGATLFNRPNLNILTHCNTGGLATGGTGTALAVILTVASRYPVHVWVDETRPLLQGARLNTWELRRYGVDATLICDNMAGMLMAQGRVDAVILGADRIARNGDFANKIGTYSLAVQCHHHKIPFYCAAPLSTFDWDTPNGKAIPIEERPAQEVRGFRDTRWAPAGFPVYNPAFDVTPARLVSAFICEKGVARRPFTKSFRAWKS